MRAEVSPSPVNSFQCVSALLSGRINIFLNEFCCFEGIFDDQHRNLLSIFTSELETGIG